MSMTLGFAFIAAMLAMIGGMSSPVLAASYDSPSCSRRPHLTVASIVVPLLISVVAVAAATLQGGLRPAFFYAGCSAFAPFRAIIAITAAGSSSGAANHATNRALAF